MKKIITAINNPKLNEELKKEKNFEVIGKDIQYKDAILEVLEKNKDIDLIIISEKIPGEIKLENLIKRIKRINEKTKIVFILEKENSDLENILIKNDINDIYYNNKINLNELIKIINKKEINIEEEIIKLKRIIEEQNEENKKRKNKKFKFMKDILRKREIGTKIAKFLKPKRRIKEIMSTKIITFSGNYKSGKSTLSLIISQYLSEKKKKVLLIDGDIEKQDLSIILKTRENINNKKWNNKNKIIYNKLKNKYFNEHNLSKNKKTIKKKVVNRKIKLIDRKKLINKYSIKNKINVLTTQINKKLYFLQGLNYLLSNKKQKKLKKTIINLLKEIEEKYEFVVIDLSKGNSETINREILKNSNINFVLMEPNVLGIKEVKRLLYIYLNKWKIFRNSLHIVANKKNIVSINKNLISNCFPQKNKIQTIKENKIYNILINNNFERKILLKNKNIKKDINKIINIIKKY